MATPEHAADNASVPAVPGVPTPWRPKIRRKPTPASTRPLSPRKAIALLVAMAVAALMLIAVTVRVAARGLAAVTAAPAVPSGRLIVPAPAIADGLPRRYRPLVNPMTVAAIAQFRQRVTAPFGPQAGSVAAGLYVEPGRVDLVTDTASWIMYAGLNSRSDLGAPDAVLSRLLASLTSPSGRTWPVAAGPGGGSARCGVTAIAGTQVSVCAWATRGVTAALMSPARDTSAAALEAILPLMRASLQSG